MADGVVVPVAAAGRQVRPVARAVAGLPGAVIAGHTRETAAEPGGLPRFAGISQRHIPAGNTIA
jgi:hypothetical protein